MEWAKIGITRPPVGPCQAAEDARRSLYGNRMPAENLRQRDLVGLLFVTALLQAYSWHLLEGYQLADSVEYMENAQAFARGVDVVDSPGLRSFGFAGLMVPIFWLADRFGIQDFKPVVGLVRLLQMGLGLALVYATARIGERACTATGGPTGIPTGAGRAGGLVAGFAVAVNPVFLQYSVSPVSGIAAGLCLARAWLVVAQPLPAEARARRALGLRAGLWLGGAVLMAYQSLIVVGPMLLAILLRDRFRKRAHLWGLATGLLFALLFQIVLDRIVYGQWGQTLTRYFMENFGSIGAVMLKEIGLTELAKQLYNANPAVTGSAQNEIEAASILLPPTWYLTNLPKMIVWPLLVAAIAGVLRCLRRPRFLPLAMLSVFLINLALMSVKGSKDFRLWLPLLPIIGVLCSLGWTWIRGEEGKPMPRAILAAGLLFLAAGLGARQLGLRNTRRFAGYWEAMDIVAERVREGRSANPGLGPAKVTSAYHWAAFLRESRDLELVKLPHHLDSWERYGNDERGETVVALLEMDWFLVHLPILFQFHELTRYVALNFEVVDVLWDRRYFENMGPLLILERSRDPAHGRLLYRIQEEGDQEGFRRERGLPPPIHLVRDVELTDESTGRTVTHREAIDFLGAEYEVLPSGHGWVTYHFAPLSELLADYMVIDRLTTPGTPAFWQNDHWPTWGVHPTRSSRPRGWQPGWIISESWPVIAAERPYAWQEPFRPLGGEWRRGDLAPADLWLGLSTAAWRTEPEGAPVAYPGRLEPASSPVAAPLVEPEMTDGPSTWRFSQDRLLQVARFLIAVHPLARAADDGRPLSETPTPRPKTRP